MSKEMSERIWSEIRIDNFDENNQIFTVDAWYTDDDNEEGEVIARIYPGTCYIEWIDERAKDDPYVQEVIREAYQKIHDTKIQLTQTVSEKIRKIAEMNAKIKKLAHEVNDELGKVGYATEYAYADDDFAIQSITEQDIISPTFEKDGSILIDGSAKAKSNSDGVYVDQTQGCCEDNYYGNVYIKMNDGKYVRIHFEM